MRRTMLLALIILAIGTLAVACGGAKSDSNSQSKITPIEGNSELVVGPNRFAMALLDKDNNMISDAGGNAVHLQFFEPDGALQSEADAHFVWAIQDVTGFWATNVTFDKAGGWNAQATLSSGGKDTTIKVGFDVSERGFAPKIGDPAPPADNLTLAQDSNMKRLSTDPQPNESFYQLTVAQALDAHKPFVVTFATPLFCQTQFCGPILNNVKAVAPEFAAQANFIHIEPFELDENGNLVTDTQGAPIAAQPTNDWHLQTEPWIFIVGADGKISSRFEGSASTDELRAAIQQALGG